MNAEAALVNLKRCLQRREVEILRLKGLLKRAQTQLDYAILRIPTEERREELSELNTEIQIELEKV